MKSSSSSIFRYLLPNVMVQSIVRSFKCVPFANLAWFFGWTFLSVIIVGVFERHAATGLNMIWIANGLILAFLLLIPRRNWIAYLIVGFIALTTSSALVHDDPILNLTYNLLDCSELAIIALLLKQHDNQLPEFTDSKYAIRFLAAAALIGPLLSALLFGFVCIYYLRQPYWHSVYDWVGSDGLGMAVTTPTCVAILRAHYKRLHSWNKHLLCMAILLVLTFIIFNQHNPMMFMLIFPTLLILLVNTEIGWAALNMLLLALIGGWFTLHGKGPLNLPGVSLQESSNWLQIAIGSCMLMLYTVSVVIESLTRTKKRLMTTANLHNLMMENSRDVIILAGMNGIRTYVSPGVRALTGWEPIDLLGKSFVDLSHPQDRAELEMVLKALKAGSDGGTLEYRVRRRNGEYFWVEANMRVYSEPGSTLPAGIMNLIRDISERKRSQHQLEESYRQLESLAVVDALTGSANRRRFDEFLHTEWRRGMRNNRPLSMILMDVDNFKLYNDTYGHVRGDSCLKQVAEAALDVVSRPGDLVARYGGEEFTVILPDTDANGARIIAEEIRKSVERRKLKHEKTALGYVTISVGYATMIPVRGVNALTITDNADKALYQAKKTGKNRVVGFDEWIPVIDEHAPADSSKSAETKSDSAPQSAESPAAATPAAETQSGKNKAA